MQRALSIYLFAAIVAEAILIGINAAVGGKPGWVIIMAGLFAYGYVTLKVSIQMHIGYRLKMILQTLLGVAVLLLIDLETGFHGWSLDYVLPGSLILMDAAIVILMIANRRNWQSWRRIFAAEEISVWPLPIMNLWQDMNSCGIRQRWSGSGG